MKPRRLHKATIFSILPAAAFESAIEPQIIPANRTSAKPEMGPMGQMRPMGLIGQEALSAVYVPSVASVP